MCVYARLALMVFVIERHMTPWHIVAFEVFTCAAAAASSRRTSRGGALQRAAALNQGQNWLSSTAFKLLKLGEGGPFYSSFITNTAAFCDWPFFVSGNFHKKIYVTRNRPEMLQYAAVSQKNDQRKGQRKKGISRPNTAVWVLRRSCSSHFPLVRTLTHALPYLLLPRLFGQLDARLKIELSDQKYYVH